MQGWIASARLVIVGLVVTGAGLVSAAAGRWSPVQDGQVAAGAVSEGIRLNFQN